METVQIQDLKAHLSELVERAEHGESIVITRHNRPVATLGPAAGDGLHVGSRSRHAALRPAAVAASGSIAATLADDRARDR